MMTNKLKYKMELGEIRDTLEAEMLCGDDYLCREIEMVYGSDLMSDVLTFIKSGSLLLTGLANSQVVRTAEMAEIAAICLVSGKNPQEETLKLAQEKKIPFLSTKCSMYESCGRLYKKGLSGGCSSE